MSSQFAESLWGTLSNYSQSQNTNNNPSFRSFNAHKTQPQTRPKSSSSKSRKYPKFHVASLDNLIPFPGTSKTNSNPSSFHSEFDNDCDDDDDDDTSTVVSSTNSLSSFSTPTPRRSFLKSNDYKFVGNSKSDRNNNNNTRIKPPSMNNLNEFYPYKNSSRNSVTTNNEVNTKNGYSSSHSQERKKLVESYNRSHTNYHKRFLAENLMKKMKEVEVRCERMEEISRDQTSRFVNLENETDKILEKLKFQNRNIEKFVHGKKNFEVDRMNRISKMFEDNKKMMFGLIDAVNDLTKKKSGGENNNRVMRSPVMGSGSGSGSGSGFTTMNSSKIKRIGDVEEDALEFDEDDLDFDIFGSDFSG